MKVKDYFSQGRRGWVRLHEKGGKEHEVPCHHSLEKILDEYIAAAGIAGDPNGPLFRTTGRKTGQAQALWQQDAYRMIQRRAAARGHQDQNRQPHLSRDRHHRLPQKQRHAGARAEIANHASRARRSSTTGGRTKFRSTRWRRLRFKGVGWSERHGARRAFDINHVMTSQPCSRHIEMTPLCKIEVTLARVLGSREVRRVGGVDEQAGVQPP